MIDYIGGDFGLGILKRSPHHFDNLVHRLAERLGNLCLRKDDFCRHSATDVPAADVLVHCAGVMANDATAITSTVKMAANLLDGLPASVERLVLVSSAYVYAPAATPATEDIAPAPQDPVPRSGTQRTASL